MTLACTSPKFILFFALLFLDAPAVLAGSAKTDRNNAKDHPLVSRYEDSVIIGYRVADYTEHQYAIGPSAGGNPPVASVWGQRTTIVYETASGSDTVAQVFKNFEQAFVKADLQAIFTCMNMDCGPSFVSKLLRDPRQYTRFTSMNVLNVDAKRGSDLGYWAGVYSRGGQRYLVSLLMSKDSGSSRPVRMAIEIVEEGGPTTGRVKLNLQADLKNAGAAEALNEKPDAEGSQDHPLLSRYPGTFISQYTVREFETFEYAVGPREDNHRRPPVESVDGRVTTILYQTKSVRDSVPQVYQNYEQALCSGIVKVAT